MSVSGSKRASFAPRLETLEDRCTPAASVVPNGSTLNIVGSALADTVEITIDDARNLVTVRASDALGRAPDSVLFANTVAHINVIGAGGNDNVKCRLVSDMTRDRTVAQSLGAGDDSTGLDFGLFKSHALSARLGLTVMGHGGSDRVRADFGDVNASNLTFQAWMGEGNDTCSAYLWGMLRGTQAVFNEQGDGGIDRIHFYNDNGSWATTRLWVNLDGGAGWDTVGLFYDDNMVGSHVFRLNGGSGSDVVQAEVHARGGSTGWLSLDIHGGTEIDRLRGVLDITPGATLRRVARMHVGFLPPRDIVLPGTTPNIVRAFDN